jgi:hypothetical protein
MNLARLYTNIKAPLVFRVLFLAVGCWPLAETNIFANGQRLIANSLNRFRNFPEQACSKKKKHLGKTNVLFKPTANS